MARGLKITVTEASNGQIHDRYTSPQYINSAYVGGTGGVTSQTGRQIQPAVYITGGSATTGSILAQKGRKAFRVTDGSLTGECTLVNTGNLTVAGTMSIEITTATPTTLYASRISNKYVWDFTGNRYRYHLATADATFVKVAYA